MKNLIYLLAITRSRFYASLSSGSVFWSAIRTTSLFALLLFYTQLNHAQNIIKLNNAGSNDWIFQNSVKDDVTGNIYYCTVDKLKDSSLNVTCLSNEYLTLWSYNYYIPELEPISGITIVNGKLHISTTQGSNTIFLVLSLFGDIIFSKNLMTQHPTFSSTVMHNNNYVISNSYNSLESSIQITRLTPGFSTLFNKQIKFADRDQIYVSQVRQFGDRIYFGGSARYTGELRFNWFFGALELNGSLAFLNEYEVDNDDQFPNHHFMAMDSVAPDLIIATGYTSDVNSGGFNAYSHGLLVKINSMNGSVIDHLILGPQQDGAWMYFLGLTYHMGKIRVCGAHGINHDFQTRGLLYGEIDLDFGSYTILNSNDLAPNTWLTKFMDFNHVSGSLDGQPVFLIGGLNGNCHTERSCFQNAKLSSINKAWIPIPNTYTQTDINYPIVDLNVVRKSIQTSNNSHCGISNCTNEHSINICKQTYIYNYSAIQKNPGRVTNLTPQITDFIHDRIDREFILNPLQEGVAIILMETQINLFENQIDTFKFFIINDTLPTINLGEDRTICTGDSLILNAGVDSARWSTGSIGKSIVIRTSGKYFASYSNICGTVSDTINITVQHFPKLNIGSDVLICGNQTATLSSNYDNTTWSTGKTGQSITVNTAGTIYAFVSIPCGLTLDTVIVYKFDKSSLSAGKDQVICDPFTTLTGSFTNPDDRIFTTDIEWKQIDLLPPVTFDNTKILSPHISNLRKDLTHSFELAIRLGNNCIQKDTVKVLSKSCFIDSCAFIIEKSCLPNGMVELKAIDANAKTIVPKTRMREFFWNIKDGPAGSGYSLRDKNPITVSNHTRYCLTSKIYSWPKGRPHTVEFAEICEEKSCDSLTLDCTGPCENFSFILSSCLDDYDEAYNLNFLPNFCRSVCINNCNYIVAIFDLNGQLIDPNFYTIKWSTGETGIASMQKGCFNYTLSVEVRRGDCVWHGRYRPSCDHYNSYSGQTDQLSQQGTSIPESESLQQLLEAGKEFALYDLYGRFISKNELTANQIQPGVYFMVTQEESRRVCRKVFVWNEN